jgi:hypothetical protein
MAAPLVIMPFEKGDNTFGNGTKNSFQIRQGFRL